MEAITDTKVVVKVNATSSIIQIREIGLSVGLMG